MADKAQDRGAFFQQAPVIVSEMRLDFTELLRTSQSIVSAILQSDEDVVTKVGMLSRILPGLLAQADCACSCSCSCSCSCTCGSEPEKSAVAPQTGRV